MIKCPIVFRRLRDLAAAWLPMVACSTFIFLPKTAIANGSIILLHFFCVPELGSFEYRAIEVTSRKAVEVLEDRGNEIAAKYGLHDARDYFNFADEEGRRNFRVVGSRKAHIVCELEGSVVDVVYEPKLMFREIGGQVTVRIDGRLVMDELSFDDQGGDSTGISGFNYNAGSKYIYVRGFLGPTSPPYLPAYNVGNIFEFGQGIPPLRDYKVVFERVIEGLEPPKSRRLPRSGR